MNEWQPIETAPKDGSDILGWRKDCDVLLIRWAAPSDFLTERDCESLGDSADIESWCYADMIGGGRLEGDEEPTYWMPLPEAPAGCVRQNAMARRYEWLRAHSWLDSETEATPAIFFGPGCDQQAPEILDSAIDDAMGYSAGLEEFAKGQKRRT